MSLFVKGSIITVLIIGNTELTFYKIPLILFEVDLATSCKSSHLDIVEDNCECGVEIDQKLDIDYIDTDTGTQERKSSRRFV